MILCIGDEIDDRDENLTAVRQCGEGCPVVSVTRESRPGGAAAVAAMVRALGADCLLIGNSRCHRQRSIKTRVRLDGQLLCRIDEDERESFSDEIVNLIASVRVEPSVVLLSDYAKGCVDRSVVEACLSRGWRVVVDPHHTTDKSIFAGAWGMVSHANGSTLEEWPRRCVKGGANGIIAFEGEHWQVHESRAELPIVDSCGAGDQLLAAIGWQLSLGNDWLAACEWGNLAAGLKCAKRGTTPVTLDELTAAVQPV